MFANGSGLGMFVAYQILKMHGGEVQVESERGKGSTFTLRVPMYLEEPKADQIVVEGAAEIAAAEDAHAQIGATTAKGGESA